jgi:histone H3/H4
MEFITKPSITRIARKAGVKSIADDCYPTIYAKTDELLNNIVKTAIIVNNEQNTKTLMVDDVYKSFLLNGYNVARSSELNVANK